MYSKTVTIVNQTGLHARPASEFIGAASKFKCDLHIKNTSTGKSANAKSIIMLLALALTKDTHRLRSQETAKMSSRQWIHWSA